MGARSAGFMAVRMAYRYPWRDSGLGAAGVAVGAGLEMSGADPAMVLVPGGLAAAAGCAGWWWLRHGARSGQRHGWGRFPVRGAGAGAAGVVLGVAAHTGSVVDPGLWLAPGGTLVMAGCTGWWWLRHVGRPQSTRAAIGRRATLDQRAGGVATWLDIAEHAGPAALRRRALALRPVTAAGLSWWVRRRMDPRQLGVEIARLGWGLAGQQVWSSVEDATLRIAPPRAGKTISLACHGQDAPGALITTSTRLDLAEMVHAARSARGAVYFFNPTRMAGIPTTLKWRVLGGCEDFGTAQRRAADLIPVSGVAEAERWDADARRILAILLHAAEVSGRGMREVVRWNSEHSEKTRGEVEAALLRGGPGGRDRVDAIRQHWGTNERTRTSVTAMLSAPLAWVRDEHIRPLADFPQGEAGQADLDGVILRGQTLHLLGHETNTGVSPLIAALVAEIAHTIRMLAEDRPGGRVDPPVTMLLDEIAIICPVPLDAWSADLGGKGCTLHAAVQSLAQLRQTWGPQGAGAILGNIGSLIVFGGSVSPGDLHDLSMLTGEHRMRVIGVDHDRVDSSRDGELRGEYRWVPVLTPSQIRALGPMQVLILKRDLPTLTGWTPKIIDRRGWRKTNLRPVDPLEAQLAGDTRLVVRARRVLAGMWARVARRPVTVSIAQPVTAGPASASGHATGSPAGGRPGASTLRLHLAERDDDGGSAGPVTPASDAPRGTGQPSTDSGERAGGSASAREALNRWTCRPGTGDEPGGPKGQEPGGPKGQEPGDPAGQEPGEAAGGAGGRGA